MEPKPEPPISLTIRHGVSLFQMIDRHKCTACYKQFKRKDHLVEHMKSAYHSVHQPQCRVCKKHCQTLESVREHLCGPLAKRNCSQVFSERGCGLCLSVFDSVHDLNEHRKICGFSKPDPLDKGEARVSTLGSLNVASAAGGHKACAIDCEMVGGDEGSVDICVKVCIVDEDENLIYETYVQPDIPISDYRYEVTGLTEEHLKDAKPLREVQEDIYALLKGENGRQALLVGHDLGHDIDCLRINYPSHLLRDTAKYRPLMKTNIMSHSLKYLTQTYLGYEIQSGTHDPYEDCVSVMRLYKKMCTQEHPIDVQSDSVNGMTENNETILINDLHTRKSKDLENLKPRELYDLSRSDYRCWCLD